MANENKKILITGGCGFIGTNLAIYLKKFNYEVSTLDNLFRKGSKYNLKLLNVKQKKGITEAIPFKYIISISN